MSKKERQEIVRDATDWFIINRPNYELLCQKVETIIKEILISENIPIHTTSCRAKDIQSFSKKIEDPKYDKPQTQITDLAGIRIIAYVESDLDKINKLVEDAFDIDLDNSLNKTDELGIDKVGYRSVHYVGKLKKERLKLPEFKRFAGLTFEIQIRTILQHAWAEIEHDKNYKFSGKLDSKIQRRFKILAGLLELADREFDSLAAEIDKIANEVKNATQAGELDIEINSTTLKSYLSTKFPNLIYAGIHTHFGYYEGETQLMQEMVDYGLKNLADLDAIIPKKFEEVKLKNIYEESNFIGLVREIMLVHDYKKYFESCWKRHFAGFGIYTTSVLNHYGLPVEDIEEQYELYKEKE